MYSVVLNTQIGGTRQTFDAYCPLLVRSGSSFIVAEFVGAQTSIRAMWANIVKNRKDGVSKTQVVVSLPGEVYTLQLADDVKYRTKSDFRVVMVPRKVVKPKKKEGEEEEVKEGEETQEALDLGDLEKIEPAEEPEEIVELKERKEHHQTIYNTSMDKGVRRYFVGGDYDNPSPYFAEALGLFYNEIPFRKIDLPYYWKSFIDDGIVSKLESFSTFEFFAWELHSGDFYEKKAKALVKKGVLNGSIGRG